MNSAKDKLSIADTSNGEPLKFARLYVNGNESNLECVQ